jgi:regulator of protease activity HflC (stomatin/prohibitin superfamily)
MDAPVEVYGTLASLIFGIAKAFRFVREGERGVKVQFGKVIRNRDGKPKIIEPGFVFLIPFVQTISKHHIRQQSYRFANQRITLKDGLIYEVGGMVIFRVCDVYKALFDIENIDKSIDDLGMAAIREVLGQRTHEEVVDVGEISKELIERVRSRAAEWGVEIIQFSLPVCAPTPETANLINASLGVNLRLSALKNELGKEGFNLKNFNPTLAAVLVGVPLTASVIPSEVVVHQAGEHEKTGFWANLSYKHEEKP